MNFIQSIVLCFYPSYRFIVLLLAHTTFFGLVNSFATDICDHDQLIEKSRDAFECSKKFDDRVFGNARNNSGNVKFCQIVKDR